MKINRGDTDSEVPRKLSQRLYQIPLWHDTDGFLYFKLRELAWAWVSISTNVSRFTWSSVFQSHPESLQKDVIGRYLFEASDTGLLFHFTPSSSFLSSGSHFPRQVLIWPASMEAIETVSYGVELKMLTRPFQASPRIKSSSLLQLRAWPGGSELECRV